MRHHLRPEQRVRLRLPARQHEVRPRGLRPARTQLRIVDEVDSILIDEARTPLIISGASEESTDTYYVVDRVIPRLKKSRALHGRREAAHRPHDRGGRDRVEKLLGSTTSTTRATSCCSHHVNQGLRAHALYKRDVDYVVKDGQVVIVDEFTGRLMPGRRWSDGCIRRSRQGKRPRLSPRTRRWRRSRSRTTSACTKSSPA